MQRYFIQLAALTSYGACAWSRVRAAAVREPVSFNKSATMGATGIMEEARPLRMNFLRKCSRRDVQPFSCCLLHAAPPASCRPVTTRGAP